MKGFLELLYFEPTAHASACPSWFHVPAFHHDDQFGRPAIPDSRQLNRCSQYQSSKSSPFQVSDIRAQGCSVTKLRHHILVMPRGLSRTMSPGQPLSGVPEGYFQRAKSRGRQNANDCGGEFGARQETRSLHGIGWWEAEIESCNKSS